MRRALVEALVGGVHGGVKKDGTAGRMGGLRRSLWRRGMREAEMV